MKSTFTWLCMVKIYAGPSITAFEAQQFVEVEEEHDKQEQ